MGPLPPPTARRSPVHQSTGDAGELRGTDRHVGTLERRSSYPLHSSFLSTNPALLTQVGPLTDECDRTTRASARSQEAEPVAVGIVESHEVTVVGGHLCSEADQSGDLRFHVGRREVEADAVLDDPCLGDELEPWRGPAWSTGRAARSDRPRGPRPSRRAAVHLLRRVRSDLVVVQRSHPNLAIDAGCGLSTTISFSAATLYPLPLTPSVCTPATSPIGAIACLCCWEEPGQLGGEFLGHLRVQLVLTPIDEPKPRVRDARSKGAGGGRYTASRDPHGTSVGTVIAASRSRKSIRASLRTTVSTRWLLIPSGRPLVQVIYPHDRQFQRISARGGRTCPPESTRDATRPG